MEEKEKQVHEDETGFISTEQLREVLNVQAEEPKKKECFFKRLFKKKNKENK